MVDWLNREGLNIFVRCSKFNCSFHSLSKLNILDIEETERGLRGFVV